MAKNKILVRNRNITIARQRKVIELHFVRKLTISEIVDAFKGQWDSRTIWRDIAKYREAFAESITVVDVRNVLLKIWATRDKVLRRLWKEVDDKTVKPMAKIRGLKAIDDIEQRNIFTLQELGFIVKPDENINISQRSEELNDKINAILKEDKIIWIKNKNAKRESKAIQGP